MIQPISATILFMGMVPILHGGASDIGLIRGQGSIPMVWLGYSSRDVYIGVDLGLATLFRLVPEPRIHARVSALVESIVDRLIEDSWIIVDNDGHKSRWLVTPSMQAAWLRTAPSANPIKYEKL